MIDPLFLTTAAVSTFDGNKPLTSASGFFFERNQALFFITSRHVLLDEPSGHHPSRIEIELHVDEANLSRSERLSVLLYQDGKSVWIDGRDSGGSIDVAAIRLDRQALPKNVALRPFTTSNLVTSFDQVNVGETLLIVGFPLGFHDHLHHLPVVRHAIVASSFGMRFQGQGLFLTDARTHRGCSGAPVVVRDLEADESLPWRLLGIHSSTFDVGNRNLQLDEALGLNCAWYADILLLLTQGPTEKHPSIA
ncbi:serine protease [Aquabacterium sp.]|uniref:S1 family peptidase n=1 Tax=Aquabacterium sp. TaxID=1872578 RepID=UPI002E330C54|nr:serine protease [Aquabacterium sp.]HEX5311992.1 serine protease [Aquabacterium sp.]